MSVVNNSSDKFLVYGANGWIGQQFISILQKGGENDFEFGSSRVDCIEALKAEISRVEPTHVISFIGRTHGKIGDQTYSTIDYLEQPGKLVENIRDNLFSPLVLALVCKEEGIHYTYLGTGCIFCFDESHPCGEETRGFVEADSPNFFGSSYSIVKGYTDRLMKFFGNVLNVRIRMPITGSVNSRNFITKITTYDKICSIPNSMTVLPELLPMVIEMMHRQVTGTINLTNPGLISHNEILTMFREIVDPSFTWDNFSLEEQTNILESDRSNNCLETGRLQELFPQVKKIKTSVRECLINYRETYVPKVIIIPPPLFPEEMKCLLVTGGAGFIGSNFINDFHPNHPETHLINYDALYYCGDVNNVCENIRHSARYTFIHGNLQSRDLLRFVFKSFPITHIIHFAAQSHVQASFDDSQQYTMDNVVGTHNLLETARHYAPLLKKLVHVSTDEVYGESMMLVDELQKTEQSVLCPTNPYAATKAAAEMLVQSYHHSFHLPIIITRGNNVYGPNQYPEKLIPKFIQQLRDNQPVTIQGDGSCVRAFLHTRDTSWAFECILTKGVVGEIYNIGCDEGMEYSVLEVAQLLIKLIKKTDDCASWIKYVSDRPFNDKRYYISNRKLRDLGWNIRVKFLDGIEKLIA
jgi:dTDP-glucose 4,6-dehydratase